MRSSPLLATTLLVLGATAAPAWAQPTVTPPVGSYDPKTDVSGYSVTPSTEPQPTAKPTLVIVGPDGQPVAESPPAATGVYHYDAFDPGEDVEEDTSPYAGPTPELHVVRQGDTLWDICWYYFNDPWQWPKVWSYNAQVTNPHWIYPGDLVRLMPKGLLAPLGIGDADLEPEATSAADTAVVNAAPMRRYDVELQQLAFIEQAQLDSSMRVVGAVDDKAMLSRGDEIYVSYPSKAVPEVGARFAVYTEQQSVKHPDTHQAIGSYVRMLGEAEILSVKQGKHARARLLNSNSEIERGARIGPLAKSFHTVAPARNEVDVQGTIVAMLTRNQLIGSGEIVFVDLGEAKGVKPGNRLVVVRRGDAMSRGVSPNGNVGQDDPAFPARALGEIVLVEVGPRLSIGLVTQAVEELGVGDRAMMREQ